MKGPPVKTNTTEKLMKKFQKIETDCEKSDRDFRILLTRIQVAKIRSR